VEKGKQQLKVPVERQWAFQGRSGWKRTRREERGGTKGAASAINGVMPRQKVKRNHSVTRQRVEKKGKRNLEEKTEENIRPCSKIGWGTGISD